MTCGLAQVRNGHRRRCPAPLQGWEWIFGEGIAHGSDGEDQDISPGGENA